MRTEATAERLFDTPRSRRALTLTIVLGFVLGVSLACSPDAMPQVDAATSNATPMPADAPGMPAVTSTSMAANSSLPKPEFLADGSLERPERYREWIYVGAPLTPNSLNPPAAPFPEFHNVYIHPDDFAAYSETGAFPEGTVIVKELVTVGSEVAVSGNGFFMGEFVGL